MEDETAAKADLSGTDAAGQEVMLCVQAHVARVTINRPARMNALAKSTLRRLMEALDQLEVDPQVRVIVLRGAGDRAFSAGVDLHELAAGSDHIRHPMGGLSRNLHEMVLEMTKPTIAAINGAAVGAGCELALACDIRIAAQGARMGLPEAQRGLGANFGSVLLPQLISRSYAMELLYTGRLIDMEEAVKIGLVNRAVASDRLDAEVDALAARIAANAPLSVRRMKAVAGRSWGLPPTLGLRLPFGPDPYTSADRHEGARAFAEKRPPKFEGR